MVLESELRINVIQAFGNLVSSIDELCEAITQDHELIAWVQEQDLPFEFAPEANTPREKTISLLKQLQYLNAQPPKEILILAGIIGCSQKTIELAEIVNNNKDKFKKSILSIKSAKITSSDPWLRDKFEQYFKGRGAETSHTLKKIGLSKLHLKQCYRKIPILKHAPEQVSWTWAHTRSIKRISVQDAYAKLAKKGDDAGVELQLKKLESLSPNEPLAVVQELAPHLRSNISYKDELKRTQRLMVKGPIPIFFPCNKSTSCPKFKPPGKKCEKNKNRIIRSDVQLDPMPFLPAIRAHRYVKN